MHCQHGNCKASNHQSWVDVLMLQRIFHSHVPFLKFFVKQQRIGLPVTGLAWRALDLPLKERGRGHGAPRRDRRMTGESQRR